MFLLLAVAGGNTIYNNDNYITLVMVYAHEHLYLHIMHLYCVFLHASIAINKLSIYNDDISKYL